MTNQTSAVMSIMLIKMDFSLITHHFTMLFLHEMHNLHTAVSVSSPGYAGYKLCYQEVLKVVKGIIHQPHELEDSNVFYAFSYYFDRAVDGGLIG